MEEIEVACRGFEDDARVNLLKAQAIKDEITCEALRASVLQILRDSRPKAPLVASGRGYAPTSARTITAALLCRMGLERLGEKTLGAEVMDSGHRMRGAHLLDLCKAALEADGVEMPAGRQDLIRAALSTYSLPTALGDLASKLLLDAYEETPATWQSFCAIRSVPDFKENTGIRPTFTGQLEPVAPGGELKHGGLSEATFKFRADTYGKMLSIDRRDLINDDLPIFDQSARAMGQAARRKVSDLVYATLLNENGAFFNDDHGNLMVGAASGLGLDSLGQALGLMRAQRDDEGNDLDLKPAVAVVPPELEIQAREILEAELKQGNPGEPTKNVLKNAVSLEVEPRLSNTVKFKSKASKRHWYLFAAPFTCPLVVAFLNGQQEPIVEFFGLDSTPNHLAASWRVYHDFGAALCDPRAGVRSAGQ